MNKNEFKAEMVRNGDTGISLSEFLGISPVTLSNKLNSKAEFTRDEIASVIWRYQLTPEKVFSIFFAPEVS